MGFGKVRLEHDAGRDAGEFRFGEDPFERGHRQFEVAVLLHIEVDEGRVRLGLSVEASHLGRHTLE